MAEPLSEYGCHRPSRPGCQHMSMLHPGLGVGILGDGDGFLGASGSAEHLSAGAEGPQSQTHPQSLLLSSSQTDSS